MESSRISLESSPALLRRSYKSSRACAELCPNALFFHRIMNNCYSSTIPLYHRNTSPASSQSCSRYSHESFSSWHMAFLVSIDFSCLRLHDTGFVMSCLRLFVRPLFVLLCHYCFLVSSIAMLSCHRFFFVMLVVYGYVDGNNHHRRRGHAISHVIILERSLSSRLARFRFLGPRPQALLVTSNSILKPRQPSSHFHLCCTS
jgi:hypothetical protein